VLNLRSIDLNLLPVFEAIHEERNLSRAAERLGMSQSAVSHALTRLRDLLRDDLFVRLPQGVQPTPLAELVYLRVRESLAGVRDLLGETRMFDPATSTRRFFVAIPHPMGPLLAGQMCRQMALTAPDIRVEFSTRSLPVGLPRKLEDGRVDIAVDWLVPAGEGFHAKKLYDDHMLLLARHGHPALQAKSLNEVIETCKFVVMRNRIPGSDVQTLPAAQNNVHDYLIMSEQLEVLLTASRTDYIGVTLRSLLKLAEESFSLEALPLSPPAPDVPIYLIWHHNRHSDPAHIYLREQLVIAVQQLKER